MFLALEGAVVDGEDELAAALQQKLAGLDLTAHERETLAAFGRILNGRQLARGLRLGLELRSDEEGYELLFTVHSAMAEDVVLNFPPVSLEHTRLGVDPRGLVTRSSTSRLVHMLDHTRIPARGEVLLSLGRGRFPLEQGLLAQRDTWRLLLRSGEFHWAGGTYPAARLGSPRCELEKLRAGLTRGAVDSADFVARVRELLAVPELPALGADPSSSLAGDLLARAVQLDPAEREATLRALAEVLAPHGNDLFRSDATGAAALDPALRWIARSGAPEASLASWARWTSAWVEKQDLSLAEESGGLILPGR